MTDIPNINPKVFDIPFFIGPILENKAMDPNRRPKVTAKAPNDLAKDAPSIVDNNNKETVNIPIAIAIVVNILAFI